MSRHVRISPDRGIAGYNASRTGLVVPPIAATYGNQETKCDGFNRRRVRPPLTNVMDSIHRRQSCSHGRLRLADCDVRSRRGRRETRGVACSTVNMIPSSVTLMDESRPCVSMIRLEFSYRRWPSDRHYARSAQFRSLPVDALL